MTTDTRYTVLVSTDEGLNWRRHAGIIATSGEQACKRVRDAHYSAGSPDCPDREGETLFYATQAFRPRRMVPQKVTKLTMQQVNLDGIDSPEVEPSGGAIVEEVAPEPHPEP